MISDSVSLPSHERGLQNSVATPESRKGTLTIFTTSITTVEHETPPDMRNTHPWLLRCHALADYNRSQSLRSECVPLGRGDSGLRVKLRAGGSEVKGRISRNGLFWSGAGELNKTMPSKILKGSFI
jgi:hypothetical protein